MAKIIVINGSPHGKGGTTFFFFQYAQKQFPEAECKIFHVGARIKKIEEDQDYFNSIIDEVRTADAVFWIYPTWIFLLPCQFKLFIELIWERGAESAFKGKYATSIVTSIHFCDDLPLNYMHGISEDLGMFYYTGFSADMEDMNKIEERKRLSLYAQNFLRIVENKIPLPRITAPIVYQPCSYESGNIEDVKKTNDYKMLLITDAEKEDKNLINMIESFTRLVPNPVEIVNLNDINIVQGCLGCGNCQFNVGQCVSAKRDDYEEMYRQKIIDKDVLILAPKIRDRYFSAKWKRMEDRRFVDNHRPLWTGKQVVYLISGPLRALPNLRQLLHIRKQVNEAEIAGIVTDEYETPGEITELIKASIKQLFWSLEKKFIFPNTYVGIGALKIFRDFIWNYQFVFPGDHAHYKEHGFYDFPKKSRLKFWFIGRIMKKEKSRNKWGKKFAKKAEAQRKAIMEEKLI